MISEVAQLEMVYQHNSKMNQSHCPGLDWYNWICRENHKYFSPTASRICKCSIQQNSVFFETPCTFPLFYTSGKYCQVLPVPPPPLLYTSARPTYSLDLKRCFAIGNEIAYQLATDISCIYVNVKCPL